MGEHLAEDDPVLPSWVGVSYAKAAGLLRAALRQPASGFAA